MKKLVAIAAVGFLGLSLSSIASACGGYGGVSYGYRSAYYGYGYGYSSPFRTSGVAVNPAPIAPAVAPVGPAPITPAVNAPSPAPIGPGPANTVVPSAAPAPGPGPAPAPSPAPLAGPVPTGIAGNQTSFPQAAPLAN